MSTDESDGAIGGGLQSLFEAVAERTHASARDMTSPDQVSPAVIAATGGGRFPTRSLVAAAAVMVVFIGAAVLATRPPSTDSGGVTVGGSTPDTNVSEPDDGPRIAPSSLPEGWVLDTVSVGPMTPVRIGWRAEWETPLDPVTGLRQRVTVLVSPAAIADLEQPLDTNPRAAQTVDVNGASATVDRYSRPEAVRGLSAMGSMVRWTTPGGAQVTVTADSPTDEAALAVARATRIDEQTSSGQTTATVDLRAIPPGALLVYEGPETNGRAPSQRADRVVSATLGYRRLASNSVDPTGIDPQGRLFINLFSIGDVDPRIWLETRQPGPVDAAEVGGLGPVSVSWEPRDTPVPGFRGKALAGPGFAVVIHAVGWTEAEIDRLMFGLRRYAPNEWATYLASAMSAPEPPRQIAAEDGPTCDGLAAASDAWAALRATDINRRYGSSGQDLRTLAANADPDMAAALNVLADYQENRHRDLLREQTEGSVPPRSWEHEDVVRLKNAARTVEAWSRSRCARFVSVGELGVVMMGLDEQDEVFNPFCKAWQDVERASNGRTSEAGSPPVPPPGPPASFRAWIPQLDAALALAPTDAVDLIEGIRHRRELWAATPDGSWPAYTPNDPDGYFVQVTNTYCPDWPM